MKRISTFFTPYGVKSVKGDQVMGRNIKVKHSEMIPRPFLVDPMKFLVIADSMSSCSMTQLKHVGRNDVGGERELDG